MNQISSNVQQPKWGMFYACFKLNINCILFFFSPNPLQSDCLEAGKLHMLSTSNYFVCFVSERASRVTMWQAERTPSQSCLFDCRLASAFDVFKFIVHVCPHVFFFPPALTGLLRQLQLRELGPPRAAAGNRGALPQARPAGLERGRTDRAAHRSLRLLLLWVHTHVHLPATAFTNISMGRYIYLITWVLNTFTFEAKY